MKFIWSIIPLMAVFTSVSSDTLQYDPKYDDPLTPINSKTVACYDKLNRAGYEFFGSIPPNVHFGGANFISVENSAACGSCWQLTSSNNDASPVNFAAIDHAEGFDFTAQLKTIQALRASPLEVNTITARVVEQEICGFISS